MVVALLPKSKRRLPVATVVGFTQAMTVRLVKPDTTPAGRLTYWEALPERVSWPLPEKAPPLGRVPFHTGPPTESAVVAPPVSAKL